MQFTDLTHVQLAVVGAGVMGRGIAQIAAQAGCTVLLFDAKPNAAAAGVQELMQTFDKLAQKAKLSKEAATAAATRLHAVDALPQLQACDVVVEAVIEDLTVKRQLFAELETIVRPDCVLATNTSSLSVTAIAAGLQHPQRVAGFHFFNPVPLMKIVEVIDGLLTQPGVGDFLIEFGEHLGHTAVRAKDTPGFIVNHAGRGYGTEALRLLNEGVAEFHQIDRILRDTAGFKLGPFELMDLTALDVSHPVMESIYHQYYEEPRFRPQPLTRQMLAAGLVGRKVGRGFYRYVDGQPERHKEPPTPAARPSADASEATHGHTTANGAAASRPAAGICPPVVIGRNGPAGSCGPSACRPAGIFGAAATDNAGHARWPAPASVTTGPTESADGRPSWPPGPASAVRPASAHGPAAPARSAADANAPRTAFGSQYPGHAGGTAADQPHHHPRRGYDGQGSRGQARRAREGRFGQAAHEGHARHDQLDARRRHRNDDGP